MKDLLFLRPPKPCRIPNCPFCSEKKTMSIDWTKPVETRNGELVRVICTNGRGKNPVIYLMDDCGEEMVGRCDYGGRGHSPWVDNELRNRKTKKKGWINIYKNIYKNEDHVTWFGNVYESKECALQQIFKDGESVYIRTAKIEWEE